MSLADRYVLITSFLAVPSLHGCPRQGGNHYGYVDAFASFDDICIRNNTDEPPKLVGRRSDLVDARSLACSPLGRGNAGIDRFCLDPQFKASADGSAWSGP
ncbi:hypothetical protein NL676_009491 [Syzygium grande]|nr:hypothetical protein NL676_009491 [Syzygium grande]